ncbi:hypothetical protein ABZ173_34115 [Streptomyces rochei]
MTTTAWATAMVAMPLTPATRGMGTTDPLTMRRTWAIWITKGMVTI